MISFVGLLFLIAPCAQAATTPADQNITPAASAKMVTIATVNIQDAKILKQVGNQVTIAFDLTNRVGVQPSIIYAINLLSKDKDGKYSIVADSHVYSNDVVSLGENDSEHKEIVYTAPTYLNGTYAFELVAKNSEGFPFGSVSLPTKMSFSGVSFGGVLFVDSPNCFLTVKDETTGKKYVPQQGVDISKGEILIAHCLVKNDFAVQKTFTPVFKTYYRTTFGKLISESPQNPFTLKAGETRLLALSVPSVDKPQAYDTVLSFVNEQKEQIASPVDFHFVLNGESATIQNLTLDKRSYLKGEIAKATFFWSNTASLFPGARSTEQKIVAGANAFFAVTDLKGKACSDEVSKKLGSVDQSGIENVLIPMTRDCVSPVVNSKIKNAAGALLAENTINVSEASTTEEGSAQNNTVAIVVSILVLIAVAFGGVFVFKKKHGVQTMIFFGLMIVSGLFGGTKNASADTLVFYFDNSNVVAGYTVNLDKSVYAPGETMSVNSSFILFNSVSDPTEFSSKYISLDVTANGQLKHAVLKGATSGPTQTYTVSSTPGTYSALAEGTYYGVFPYLKDSEAVPYTVVPLQKPVVVFSIDPTTVNKGEPVSASWYTSYATACTASGDLPEWSGNQTAPGYGGTSFYPNTPGSYTLSLTCTGPGGQTVSSSRSLTVTNFPPPTPTVTSFGASTSSIQEGQAVDLSWTASSTNSCNLNGPSLAWGFGIPMTSTTIHATVYPPNVGTNDYSLTCTGPGGTTAPQSVTVNVIASPSFTVTLSASPTTVTVGGTTTLSWTTPNAVSCNAIGGVAGDQWAGYVQPLGTTTKAFNIPADTLPGTYTYKYECTNAALAVKSASVNVVVQAVYVNTPPIANAGVDKTTTANVSVTLDGSGSSDTKGALSYFWDFGDGSTFVSQPGPSDGKDTDYGSAYHPTGCADCEYLYSGGWGDSYNDFFEFNLNDTPASGEVVKAEIWLWASRPADVSGGNDPGFQMYRVTSSWTEAGLTRASNPTETFYKEMPKTIPTDGTGGWVKTDITDMYKGWKDGTYQNYGIEVMPTNTNHSNGSIISSDSADAAHRPKLVVYQKTFVSQPGPVEGKDTVWGTVYGQPSCCGVGGFPDMGPMYAGGWADWWYNYYEFNLTGSTEAANTSKAEIWLWASRPADGNDPGLQMYKITAPWTEASTTRTVNPTSAFYKAMPTTIPADGTWGWVKTDITDLYKDWKNGVSPNYGVKIVPTNNNHTAGSLSSSDNSDAEHRPKLVVYPVVPESATAVVNHTYTTPGTYTATLIVTDEEGLTSLDTATITVGPSVTNQYPVAEAGGDKMSLVNNVVSFNGSGSTDDGSIVSYVWDFGDASPKVTQPGPEGKDTVYGTVYATGGMPDMGPMYSGGWGDWYYNYYQFDLTGTPTAASTTKAEIWLGGTRPAAGNDPAFQMRRITAAWTEVGVKKTSNPASTLYATMPVSLPTDGTWGWIKTDVTTLYNGWKNGTYTNYGVKIVPTNNNNTAGSLSSGDNANTEERPKLVVYTTDVSLGSGVTVNHTFTSVGTYTVKLTVTDDKGLTSFDTTTVTVKPAIGTGGFPYPTLAFDSNPPVLPNPFVLGSNLTLGWTTTNASSCEAYPADDTPTWNGLQATGTAITKTITPITDGIHTFGLRCIGYGGDLVSLSKTITIVKPAPTLTFYSFPAAPSTLNVGQDITLYWGSNNTDSCTAVAGDTNWTGSKAIGEGKEETLTSPAKGTHTYAISCHGIDGTTVTSPSIVVAFVDPPPQGPQVIFKADKKNIFSASENVKLEWGVSGADSCDRTATPGTTDWTGTGLSATGGNVTITPGVSSHIYTLQCSKVGGGTDIKSWPVYYCGNNVCEPGETIVNCRKDCKFRYSAE
jgi:PKD repeat protein